MSGSAPGEQMLKRGSKTFYEGEKNKKREIRERERSGSGRARARRAGALPTTYSPPPSPPPKRTTPSTTRNRPGMTKEFIDSY